MKTGWSGTKRNVWIGLIMTGVILSPVWHAWAQSTVPTAPESERSQLLAQTYQPDERGQHFRNWNSVTTWRDPNGRMAQQTNLAFVELQTGMHYWDGVKWAESQEIIEAYPGGAIAQHGPHKVVFAENLNSEVVVDLQMADGTRLQSRVLGLRYFDAKNGKGVTVAEVKASAGRVIGSNQVVYADAFTDIAASVRYTYTKAGFEQDVIVERQLPLPEQFGLDSTTTRLQVLTEFVQSPEPVVQASRRLGQNDLADQVLVLGTMLMPQGKSFILGGDFSEREEVPIAKRWSLVEGRNILFEEVQVTRVAAALKALPAGKRSASLLKKSSERIASVNAKLPGGKPAKRARREMQMASVSSPTRGLVLDYSLLSSASGVTLKGDTTYYVSGSVNLSGATTIEGGAVVKFASGTTPKINILGSVDCRTAPYRPAVFTAKDDNGVGETISGSTGSPGSTKYGNGLNIGGSGAALNYLRFCYANSAIRLLFSYGQIDLADLQIVNCLYGVDFNGNSEDTVNVDNSLFHVINNVTKSGYDNYLRARHLTVDNCAKLFAIGNGNHNGEAYLTNCVLATVTALGDADVFDGTHNGFYQSPTFGLNQRQEAGSPVPFQSLGNGAHYLRDSSGFRSQGSTDIPSARRDALKTKTTYPPTERGADFIADETLVPLVSRDVGCNPDLGYHYDALDYVLSGRIVNTATLTLDGGVAIAVYGVNGLKLESGAKLLGTGLRARPNRLVRYQVVQEQPELWGGTASVMDLVEVMTAPVPPVPLPEVRLRFTDVSVMSDAFNRRHFLYSPGSKQFKALALTDCSLRGSVLDLLTRSHVFVCSGCETTTVALTNCLSIRAYFGSSQGGGGDQTPWDTFLYNNLFTGCAVNLDNEGGSGVWAVYDNLFDTVSLSEYGTIPNGYNGYKSTTALSGGSNNKTLSVCDYQIGRLGNFYYPSSGANLWQLLVNTGSRSASDAKLDDRTTQTSDALDSDAVDIGFHFGPVLAPTASSGSAQTCPNTAVTLVLSADDPNGLPLSYTILSSPTHGSLSGCAPNLVYTPNQDYCGQDSFTFKVNNGYYDSPASPPAVFTITMAGDPNPAAYCQDVMTGKGVAVNINLSGSTTCPETLGFTIVTGSGKGPFHGGLGIITRVDATHATVLYTPDPTYDGPDSFEFQVTSCGAVSASTTVSINVVTGPTLSVECLPRSITLKWTLPAWLQQLAAGGYVKDFQIFRCPTASGNCTPTTTVYATVDDPVAVRNPALWSFHDTGVVPGTVYCYRLSFRHQDACDAAVAPYESPNSNTACSSTCCPDTEGPFWTDYGGTDQELAEWIMAGTGVTVVPSSAHFTGAGVAKGTFGNGANAGLPFAFGVMLSTGDIGLAKGPNDQLIADMDNGKDGDADLDTLVEFGTLDAAALEFDITASAATNIVFEYLFASEEYSEWIGAYNDMVGIFVTPLGGSKQNVALVPGTTDPVAVNTIHNGNDAGTIPPSNPTFFESNIPASLNIRYDGLTTGSPSRFLTTVEAPVAPGTSYHIKIVIADAAGPRHEDRYLDSSVFLRIVGPCQPQ